MSNISIGISNILSSESISFIFSGEVTIDWGDGIINSLTYHTYNLNINNLTIQISSSNLNSFNGGTGLYITNLASFTYELKISSLSDLSNLFSNVQTNFNINFLTDIENVANLSHFFNNCVNFNQAISLVTSNVLTDISYFLNNCTNFDSSIYISDTSSVTNMNYFLNGCVNFNQDFSYINASNLTSATNILTDTNLSVTNFSNFLNQLATTSVNNNVDLGIVNLKYSSDASENINMLLNSHGWTMTGVELITYNISIILQETFLSNYISFNIDGVYTINWGDGFTDSLNYHTYLNLPSSLNVTITSSNMSYFNGGTGIYLTNLSSFEYVVKINTLTNLSNLFGGVQTNFFFNSTTETDNVNNVSGMFQNTKFNSVLKFSTYSTTNMDYMFNDSIDFNQDISNFNVGFLSTAINMLNNTNMSIENYSKLLYSWASQEVQLNVVFGANGLKYDSYGESGRNTLLSDNWNISGDSLSCLFPFCKILTPFGYKKIDELRKYDCVISNKQKIIKKIHVSICDLNEHTSEMFLPCVIPKGTINALDDIYITSGHALRWNEKWGSPHDFGMRKCNYQELINLGLKKIKYYHVELFSKKNENRRDNYLICEGVIVESYSQEKL